MAKNILSCLTVAALATLATAQYPFVMPYAYGRNDVGFNNYFNPFLANVGMQNTFEPGFVTYVQNPFGMDYFANMQKQMEQMQQQMQQQFQQAQEALQEQMRETYRQQMKAVQEVFDTLKALGIEPENVSPQNVSSIAIAVANGLKSVSMSGHDSQMQAFKIVMEDEKLQKDTVYGTILIKTSAGKREYHYQRSFSDKDSKPTLIDEIPADEVSENLPSKQPENVGVAEETVPAVTDNNNANVEEKTNAPVDVPAVTDNNNVNVEEKTNAPVDVPVVTDNNNVNVEEKTNAPVDVPAVTDKNNANVEEKTDAPVTQSL